MAPHGTVGYNMTEERGQVLRGVYQVPGQYPEEAVRGCSMIAGIYVAWRIMRDYLS